MSDGKWYDDIPGGYQGGRAPEQLQRDVKTMDRTELEERYLDATSRVYGIRDDFDMYALEHSISVEKEPTMQNEDEAIRILQKLCDAQKETLRWEWDIPIDALPEIIRRVKAGKVPR